MDLEDDAAGLRLLRPFLDGIRHRLRGAGNDAEAGAGSLSDQVMNSALKYKLQAPLVDSLLTSAGINPSNVTELLKS